MAKKHWIYIKRGLSEDAKHRAAMGECIWLYMHIIDRADWETGIAYGWKDEQEAADMSMPVRTLREQRRKLDELDYITCNQNRHDQDIVIKRWIDPRNYSGDLLNVGDAPMEPTKNEGYTQGYIEGDTKGSSQNVTPTFNSKKSKSKSKREATPLPPEIALYRSVVKRNPNTEVYGEVISAIQKISARLSRPCEATDLQPYFNHWLTKTTNRANFSVWLLEWAVSGVIPGRQPIQQTKGADRMSNINNMLNGWLAGKEQEAYGN